MDELIQTRWSLGCIVSMVVLLALAVFVIVGLLTWEIRYALAAAAATPFVVIGGYFFVVSILEQMKKAGPSRRKAPDAVYEELARRRQLASGYESAELDNLKEQYKHKQVQR